jgi:hypothetical protein
MAVVASMMDSVVMVLLLQEFYESVLDIING